MTKPDVEEIRKRLRAVGKIHHASRGYWGNHYCQDIGATTTYIEALEARHAALLEIMRALPEPQHDYFCMAKTGLVGDCDCDCGADDFGRAVRKVLDADAEAGKE